MLHKATPWLVLLGVLWLATLPLRPLFDPDEGRYAEIPREMVAAGNWITPTLNEFKYFEKPPLQYWATAALYEVFGVHAWTARLWAALLAFLCIPLVFAFGRQIGQAPDTALVAAALLAINPYFALTGQLNLLDQGFCFFLNVALFAFVIAQQNTLPVSRSRHWMLLTWAALALAVLSKGIVALVLAGASLVAYVAVTRNPDPLKRLHLATGLPLFLLIATPWFWRVQRENPEFLQFFFVHEHFERFLTKVHARVQPFWFFLPIVLIALLPVIGNWRSWRLQSLESGREPGKFRPELFLLLWCVVVVVFFSLSQSKLASYVLPAMPALAVVLAGVTQGNAAAYPRAKRAAMGFLPLVAVALIVAGWHRSGVISATAVTYALLVAIGCATYLVLDRTRRSQTPARGWMRLAAATLAGYQVLILCYAASFADRSARDLAVAIHGRIPADTRLYSVGQYRHSLAFYLRRPLAVYDYRGELDFGMRQAQLTESEQGRGQFLVRWQQETAAIAFLPPKLYATLSAAGMPGRVIGRDTRSVAVSRS